MAGSKAHTPDGGARGAGTREPEDDAGAICEDKAQTLLGSHAAVYGIGVAEVIGSSHLKLAQLGACRTVLDDLAHVVHHLVGWVIVYALIIVATAPEQDGQSNRPAARQRIGVGCNKTHGLQDA